MNWYLNVIRKYAVFGGRARRKEYWMVTWHLKYCSLEAGAEINPGIK